MTQWSFTNICFTFYSFSNITALFPCRASTLTVIIGTSPSSWNTRESDGYKFRCGSRAQRCLTICNCNSNGGYRREWLYCGLNSRCCGIVWNRIRLFSIERQLNAATVCITWDGLNFIGCCASSITRSIYNLFFIDCCGIYTNDLDFLSKAKYRNGLTSSIISLSHSTLYLSIDLPPSCSDGAMLMME